MHQWLGVLRYEYRMSTRRASLWIIFGLLLVSYLTNMLMPPMLIEQAPTESQVLSFAGTLGFFLNLFSPLIGGILIADRLVRDRKLGMEQLLQSTPLSRGAYLSGKYLGALLSIITPALVTSLIMSIKMVMDGAPISTVPTMLLAFVGINLPAYIFVTAFSLVCPLVMPLRVYQVLFTGYWFWGNFLSPEVLPTVNGTYLTANGHFMLLGLFGGFYGGGGPNYANVLSQADAIINVVVLALFAGLALLAGDRILALRARQA